MMTTEIYKHYLKTPNISLCISQIIHQWHFKSFSKLASRLNKPDEQQHINQRQTASTCYKISLDRSSIIQKEHLSEAECLQLTWKDRKVCHSLSIHIQKQTNNLHITIILQLLIGQTG